MFCVKQSLDEQNNWFIIFNKTSDSNGLAEYYRLGGKDALPIWSETPYEDWHEVMPYIAALDRDSGFVEWVINEAKEDWGMFVASNAEIEEVCDHLRGLTQVWLSSSNYAFFRFFDPMSSIDIANFCNEQQRAELMGPCTSWLSTKSHSLNREVIKYRPEREFPWWQVPEEVKEKLVEDTTVLVNNLIQSLHEIQPGLSAKYGERVLLRKTERFCQRYKGEFAQILEKFVQLIQHEQKMLGNIK
ncbi:DUF4123 domain-containing protein [Vibrio sp. LaRot3]|uniref:DUF4123 domain-containing protein n=1 Tax=Vibrio sp. LaRot3 TaxID=2998829 RepID=UPI0022CE26C4|nr:DUF4123 domain-containing protein [Vibrio sp. LaRot3]MDA0150103.1 DUF4123 domain-containing protein [Vibrio sp. LaRot3]